MAFALRPTAGQRGGCCGECRRSRTVDLGAADACDGWLVSPARPYRIESSINSSTRGTHQEPTVFEPACRVWFLGRIPYCDTIQILLSPHFNLIDNSWDLNWI